MSLALAARAIAAAALFALPALPASAQQQTRPQPAAAPPTAATPPADPYAGLPAPRSEDVASIEAILAAVYGSISGDVGQKRDWNRFRSLFHPGARLVSTGSKGTTTARIRAMTPEDYVATSGPFLERIGFHEVEVARKIDRYGYVAHVFSTYEGHSKNPEMPPTIRGINSIQLFYDGNRWWVMNIFWMQESPAFPIPPAYLPARR